ncbi:YtcA family lipoprotein [Enterobacter bugandensis]|uniref:YtcA family lipoprotein n=1 Tax=Enterobacter bugandensis TaxID=881260 RepID=UPI003A102A2D
MKDRLILLVVLVSQLNGCAARSPSINILGAYFPDWLFCISGGCLASAAVYMTMTKMGRHGWLSPYLLTYPLLITFFSMGFWILFFY